MAGELNPAEQFFYNVLSTDSALAALCPGGFHSERIQQAQDGNYLIWTFMGGPADTSEVQGIRIYSEAVYLVRIIGKTSDFGTLQSAAARADELLHRKTSSVLGNDGIVYTILWCVRERPYSQVEQLVDIERRQLGGYYRVLVQP